jgi:hypothetical protein
MLPGVAVVLVFRSHDNHATGAGFLKHNYRVRSHYTAIYF